MRSRIIVEIIVLVVAIAISFLGGEKYGALKADWSFQRKVVLTEEMVLLSDENKPAGRIPSGTTLYVVRDPWGDKTSMFKLYLQTDSNDETPLQPRAGNRREHDVYRLKSLAWLARIKW